MTDDPAPPMPGPDAPGPPVPGPAAPGPDAPRLPASAHAAPDPAAPDPSEVPGPPAARPGRRRPVTRLVVSALCALLGFALVVQVRRTAEGDTLASARPDELVQILDGLQRQEDDLLEEIAELQGTLDRLRSSGASAEEALAEAERQAEALGILAGTVPATGPGVTAVVRDTAAQLPPEVLLDAVQELRNAGAEAIAIGGGSGTAATGTVRIGVDSAVTGAAGAVVLDGTPLVAPYVIRAIGDPATLAAALAIPGGVLDVVRRGGGELDVTQADMIEIDVLRPVRNPQYARPTGG